MLYNLYIYSEPEAVDYTESVIFVSNIVSPLTEKGFCGHFLGLSVHCTIYTIPGVHDRA